MPAWVLQEVVGPAYARLLAQAARELHSSPAFYALWPVGRLQHPWALVPPALYAALAQERVVYSAADGGTWLLPAQAVYSDATVDRCVCSCS